MADRVRCFSVVTVAAAVLVVSVAARGDAPKGRFVPGAAGIVDTVTGLTWQPDAATDHDYASAAMYCKLLVVGGVQGWRLPTQHELYTIIDERRFRPALDPAFGTTPRGFAWSSRAVKGTGGTIHWGVDFTFGNSVSVGTDERHEVRCVR